MHRTKSEDSDTIKRSLETLGSLINGTTGPLEKALTRMRDDTEKGEWKNPELIRSLYWQYHQILYDYTANA